MDPVHAYSFECTGVAVIPQVLTEAQVAEAKRLIHNNWPSNIPWKFPVMHLGRIFWEMLTQPLLLELANDLAGEHFRFDHAFGLMSNEKTIAQLHGGPQSNQHACFYSNPSGRPSRVLTGRLNFGFCLEGQNSSTGGFCYVPGSHKSVEPRSGLQVFEQIYKSKFDHPSIVVPTLNPGDMVMFTEGMVHGDTGWRNPKPDSYRMQIYFMMTAGFACWRDPSENVHLLQYAKTELEKQLLEPPWVGRCEETATTRAVKNKLREPTLSAKAIPLTVTSQPQSKPFQPIVETAKVNGVVKNTLTLIRIIGTENTPRDIPGKREESLQSILKTELDFPGVFKFYILNRIFDVEYLARIRKILNQHKAPYMEIPFPEVCPTTVEDFKVHGVGLNKARNLAIEIGSKLTRYTAVLDGDCFFEPQGIQPILEEIQRDEYRYLSIPFRRLGASECSEPQLIFRDDSDFRFDESLGFGNATKLELLWRLGHDRTPLSSHLKISGNLTKLVGEVLHYPTGNFEAENSVFEREKLRNESMQLAFERACAR